MPTGGLLARNNFRVAVIRAQDVAEEKYPASKVVHDSVRKPLIRKLRS